jgi:diguanylate cyclase (GGDEF)-like protein
LGSLPTTDSAAQHARPPPHRTRIGRRVVLLFIVSALVPLGVCGAILYREFSAELERAQEQSLDEIVRSYGITVVGRLESADDTFKYVVSDSAATDTLAETNAAKLVWIHSLARVPPGTGAPQAAGPTAPNAKQQAALRQGRSALLQAPDRDGRAQIYMVRTLPSGAWLYAQLDPQWLWSDANDFADGAGLLVLDERGRQLTAAGDLPPPGLASGPRHASDHWMSRSWELFLGSRFASPSWRVIALRERPTILASSNTSYLFLFGLILLTILLIAWLSMTSIRRQLRPLQLLMQATRRIAHRDFGAFRGLTWNDEFGDLARSFDTMSEKLKTQFDALEALSDVDRLLLDNRDLEAILDTLLARMTAVLGCHRVSVLLFDEQSAEHVRVYEYSGDQAARLHVRRTGAVGARLRSICDHGASTPIDATVARELSCFSKAALEEMAAVQALPLRHHGDSAGLLCLGYTSEAAVTQDRGVAAADFADRLSLILVNLRQSDRLRVQANFDSLTGLQNRHLFSVCVRAAISAAAQRNGIGSLLYVDLDQFKRVNDTAGHAAGDSLLRIVGERLVECVGPDASIARLGGDEFAVLLPSLANADEARERAERIIAHLEPPILVDGRQHRISASIGITIFPADGVTLEDLLKTGDIAMYHAKDTGRGKAVFFHSDMQRKLLHRLRLENGMHRTFLRGGFQLHYQPIVAEAGSGGFGVEALVRWPGEGDAPWISPSVFIPLAEENGLIVKLGEWILRSACEQFALWRRAGLDIDYVSVNVSVRQLKEPGYLENLLATLREFGMHGGQLQIEITESVLAQEAELRGLLDEIASQDIRLALDDFGTGYSSLGYLRQYPIHTVKIDRSFFQGVPRDPVASRLAQSIIVMCTALGKNVVAEGIETDEQRSFLLAAGCGTLQGHLLGRPMEAADIPAFFRRLGLAAEEELPADCA